MSPHPCIGLSVGDSLPPQPPGHTEKGPDWRATRERGVTGTHTRVAAEPHTETHTHTTRLLDEAEGRFQADGPGLSEMPEESPVTRAGNMEKSKFWDPVTSLL